MANSHMERSSTHPKNFKHTYLLNLGIPLPRKYELKAMSRKGTCTYTQSIIHRTKRRSKHQRPVTDEWTSKRMLTFVC